MQLQYQGKYRSSQQSKVSVLGWYQALLNIRYVYLQIFPSRLVFLNFLFMEEPPTYANENKTKRQWVVHGYYSSIVSCQRIPVIFQKLYGSFCGFDIFIYYCTVSCRTPVALGVHSGHRHIKILTAIFVQKRSNRWPDHHASCI